MDPKDIINEIRADWEQFKAENDRRLKEIAKNGEASAETTQRVDRLNAAIDANQNVLTQRIEDLETRLNRPFAGGMGGTRATDSEMRYYAKWLSLTSGRPTDAGQVDMAVIQNYNRAFNDWARHGDRATTDSLRLLNELSIAASPDPGILVSPDTTGRIMSLLDELTPLRQLASVQQIAGPSLEGLNDLDEADAGWVGETATRTGNTNTPDLGGYSIAAEEQYAEPNVSQKTLDDALFDVEAWLSGKVSRKFSRSEGTAYVTGSGIKKPRGFTTYLAGTPSAAAWDRIEQVKSGDATKLTADGLIDLIFALKDGYLQGSIFGMKRLTQASVRKFKDGQNNYLWQPDFAQLGRPTLVGFPIWDMPDLDSVAAGKLPVVFGNFKAGYQIVDRGGVRTLRDPYTRKGYVKFYTTKRTGGGMVNYEAIKIQVIGA